MTIASYRFVISLILAWFLFGCEYIPINAQDMDVYVCPLETFPTMKYNPLEQRYEITDERSELRYNYFENEWQFVQ